MLSAITIGLAACAARVPAPVVYKGMFPKVASAPLPLANPVETSPEITTVELRPPRAVAPRSKKLTLRGLIEKNRLEALLRFRESPRRARGRVHTVAAGETAYGISRRYGIDIDSLGQANNLDGSYRIRVGQELKLPGPRTATVVVAGRTSRSSRVPDVDGPGASSRGLDRSLPPRAGSFRWPVRGELLADYGPQPGGLHNAGINIAAPVGTPILASEAGIVAYVGDDVQTLGNLILIRHTGGWVTAYAHNDSVAVKRGKRVARGDVIGLTGATGNVDRPQLHFEIRKETEAVNPIGLLGNQTAARQPRPLNARR